MNDDTDARKVLLQAADVIERMGWAQGTIQRSTGEVCAVGAIVIAVTGVARCRFITRYQRVVMLRANVLLGEQTGGMEMISRWNDDPQRTQDEVVGLMREIGSA